MPFLIDVLRNGPYKLASNQATNQPEPNKANIDKEISQSSKQGSTTTTTTTTKGYEASNKRAKEQLQHEQIKAASNQQTMVKRKKKKKKKKKSRNKSHLSSTTSLTVFFPQKFQIHRKTASYWKQYALVFSIETTCQVVSPPPPPPTEFKTSFLCMFLSRRFDSSFHLTL